MSVNGRSDPSVLPLGYWHMRSQEYRTFNQRKKIDVKLTVGQTACTGTSMSGPV